jgi:membrane associated rhomboid family serine protease
MPLTLSDRDGLATLTLLCSCLAVFISVALADSADIVSRKQIFGYLALSSRGITQHHIYQFLTYPFLHADVWHLAFNMLGLAMLGPGVEERLGCGRYIALSALCSLFAALGCLAVKFAAPVAMCGYSGIVFGLLVGQACYFPDRVLHLFALFPMKMKHAVLVLGALELYLTAFPDHGLIAQPAHLFGAVGAWVYLTVIDRFAAKPAWLSASPGVNRGPRRVHRFPDVPTRL